jgi:AmmeMemoRadiSam system protein A
VPLYFLQRNGWNGKVVALGYSYLSDEHHLRFGNCIRQAIATLRRPVAFIASGDLSHRLKPGAPAGFNPEAHRFDEAVVEAIRSCQPHRIATIGQDVRRLAGECGYRSMLVALGVIEDAQAACEVLSYEGPFGVGYLVAQLMSADAGVPPASAIDRADETSAHPDIPALARQTIETFVSDGTVIHPPPNAGGSDLSARAGCFVSIKTRAGDLRGCIGTIDPVKDSLAEEIIANALGAATRDPRFPPVRAEELPNLKYSVDVLSAPEPCTLADLDPKIYGVIVEDKSGRRGLLLPNLEGIKTATEQVEIASRKAGIAPGSPVKLSRFRADRYSE